MKYKNHNVLYGWLKKEGWGDDAGLPEFTINDEQFHRRRDELLRNHVNPAVVDDRAAFHCLVNSVPKKVISPPIQPHTDLLGVLNKLDAIYKQLDREILKVDLESRKTRLWRIAMTAMVLLLYLIVILTRIR